MRWHWFSSRYTHQLKCCSAGWIGTHQGLLHVLWKTQYALAIVHSIAVHLYPALSWHARFVLGHPYSSQVVAPCRCECHPISSGLHLITAYSFDHHSVCSHAKIHHCHQSKLHWQKGREGGRVSSINNANSTVHCRYGSLNKWWGTTHKTLSQTNPKTSSYRPTILNSWTAQHYEVPELASYDPSPMSRLRTQKCSRFSRGP